jgi:nucleotide-binding universal stress UspA family protein
MSAVVPAHMLKKIIVGYDDSDYARDALVLGIALARATGAELLPAAVYQEQMPVPYGACGSARWEVAKRAHALETAEQAPADTGVTTTPHAVASTSPPRGLYQLATAERADLVVVGSSKHGPGALGSVSHSLLHGCPCSVAVAPPDFRLHGHHPFETIGVAYDGEPESERALARGIELAKATGATLRIITIAMAPEGGFEDAGFYQAGSAEQKQAMIDHMQGLMDKAVERAKAAGVEAAGTLEVGSRARLAEQSGIDLMLTGSRSYGPVRVALLGSVSRRLVDAGRFPVIVVPRSAAKSAEAEAEISVGAATT